MNDKILVIYHGGCSDGFGAAWAIRKALGDDVEFYPGVYNKAPPDVSGRDVIMVDFSYKRPVIEQMAQFAHSILILDHHKTAQEDLRIYAEAPDWNFWRDEFILRKNRVISDIFTPVHVLFDMHRSGAGIAWDYFHPDTPRPLLIDFLQDRDLWIKQMNYSDEVTINIRSFPMGFDQWDIIAERIEDSDEFEKFVAEAVPIQRYYRRQVEAMKEEAYAGRFVAFSNDVGMFVNAPYQFASDVAGEICPPLDGFGVSYFRRKDGMWQYSLRSRGGFDVSAIAKHFGGGGHKAAAGFESDMLIHTRIDLT